MRQYHFRLTETECAAVRALGAQRTEWASSGASRRAPPATFRRIVGTARLVRVAGRDLRRVVAGRIVDNRLAQFGSVLVHDHSDRQFARLIARATGVGLRRVEPLPTLTRGVPLTVAIALSLLSNARRIGLLDGSYGPEFVRTVARGLIVSTLELGRFHDSKTRPRALVLSGDVNATRLLLGFVARRAGVPIVLVLHDHDSHWDNGAEWLPLLPAEWIVAHQVGHAAEFQPPPRRVCLFSDLSLEVPKRVDAVSTVGVVVSAFARPEHVMALAEMLVEDESVAHVKNRLHPRSRRTDWPEPPSVAISYADSEQDLESFASEIFAAVTDGTSAANRLARLRVPCLAWGGFYGDSTGRAAKKTWDVGIAGVYGGRFADDLAVAVEAMGRRAGEVVAEPEFRLPVFPVAAMMRDLRLMS